MPWKVEKCPFFYFNIENISNIEIEGGPLSFSNIEPKIFYRNERRKKRMNFLDIFHIILSAQNSDDYLNIYIVYKINKITNAHALVERTRILY